MIPVIQHLWACCPLQVRTWTGRCQRGWWNFSWDCTARGSSARNLVAPSGSEALESNSGSISVGDRVETVLSGWQLSTTLCFTQFQYMWLTYTGTIAFILVTSCYSRMLQQLFALSFSWLSLPHVRHNKIKVVQTLLASRQRGFFDAFLCQWSNQWDYISLLLQNLQADPQMQDAAGWDAWKFLPLFVAYEIFTKGQNLS